MQPEIIRNEKLATKIFNQLPREKIHKVSEYNSVYVGKVRSTQYLLDKGQVLSDVVKDLP